MARASFDAALALLVVQEFAEPAAAVREMKRVTRPGGLLAASAARLHLGRRFWTPFLLGATGASVFARDLDAATVGTVGARVRQMIGERWGEGGFTLAATAFAVARRA